MRWVTRTMTDVRQGDRIRRKSTGGELVEMVVESALSLSWPNIIRTKADSTWWDTIAQRNSDVRVRLLGRDKLYVFQPDLPVDIHLAEGEIEMHELLGWENRICVLTEPVKSLAESAGIK